MKLLLILSVLCTSTLADDAIQEFTEVNKKFTASVYKEISKSESGNFLISPLSAETILTLTLSGSKGQTAAELQNVLHLSDNKKKNEEEIKSFLSTIEDSISYTFHLANKIYLKNNFHVKNDFRKVAKDVFSSDSESIDFTRTVKAAQVMNNWVEKQTENKIQNLISPDVLDNNTRAVLINALYFKADWIKPFHLTYTHKINFQKSNSEVVKVDAMSNKYGDNFLFFECSRLNSKFLELPFKGRDASMTIILPNDKQELSKLENKINYALLPHNLTSERVDIALPKFKIETRFDLKKILKKLGLITIFKDFEADLSGIAGEKGDLVVSEVTQKSFIDLNENGVEAAAATFETIGVPMMGYSDPPKEFKADHPFLFYIKVKEVIVFIGRVVDPRK